MAMTTYASSAGFPFIIEFDTDDAREVTPIVHRWMDDARTIQYDARTPDGQVSTILINFALVPVLLVSTWDPRDGDEDDERMTLPISRDQFQT